ncbi:hypothetical protein, partial [Hydrogenophaga sp.]|uniref:hypothetical protein n=1 Tax=Hydrogenophaga sp. TaxID=1904254 RepID=UPI002731842F
MEPKQMRESSGASLRVLLGSRAALAIDIPVNSILVVPSSNGWNDFGHHTWIDYRIRMSSAKQPVEASGFIGFIDPKAERNGKDLLQQLVSSVGVSTITATADHRFFTML